MTQRRLSRQQLARIQKLQDKRRERAGIRSEQGTIGEQYGLIITHYGTTAIVENDTGTLIRCTLRRNLDAFTCGDRVIWEPGKRGEGVITALLPRQSLLQRPDSHGRLRPVAANIDQIAVIIAPRPEPSEALIDRYLVAIETVGVMALLVVNKIDLLDADDLQSLLDRLAVYRDIGYPMIQTSTKLPGGLDRLHSELVDRTSLLVGQSGVGKSSLTKTLLPERDIRIQALSETTGLGTHTTSVSTLYHLPGGGDLIDSPGVRGFEPGELSVTDLAWGFREFRPLLGQCRFANCTHTVEPNCAVLDAVAGGRIDQRRLASYQQLKTSA